jgi:flagella basal body P-ring formation protein FlgA
MKWLRMLALLVIPLAGLDARAGSIILHEEAFVRGPQIKLGDIAELEGDDMAALADVEVMPAPLPGVSKQINASLITARLRTAGVDLADLEVKGATAVRTTTMALDITRDMIEMSLREYITSVMPWEVENAQIEVTPPTMDYVVPDGILEVAWEASPTYNFLGSGAFRGTVLVDGTPQKQLTCRASVEAFGDIVIAAHDIPRGRLVSAADLIVEKRALSSLKSGHFRDPAEVVGNVTRSTVFPGTVITRRHVTPPTVVKRNQIVQVELASGGLYIQTQARAMQDGAAGDTIPLSNVDTKEMYYGTIRKDGVVILE